MAEADSGPTHDPAALRARYLAERDKRLRTDTDRQYRAAEGEFAHFVDDPYAEPDFTRDAIDREVDTLVVGGGFGGLLSAVRLTDHGVDDFLIVEQGADFGGTWYWNRYPGVRCDIESYIYLPLLEEVGTIPTERYSTGAEIFAHCQAIGRHYGLYERALFQTRVTDLSWDEDSGRWIATTDRGDRIAARFVTVSQGPLAKVKLPGIPGIESFKGKMFHSARWDYDYTGGDQAGGLTGLSDKVVAVIGTGATAVQIVPKVAADAKHLYVFQRTPSAIDVRANGPTDADWFRSQPEGWLEKRRHNFLQIITNQPHEGNAVGDKWTDFFTRVGAAMRHRLATNDPTPPPQVAQKVDYAKMGEIRDRVNEQVIDPATAEKLKPWYNYMCKRPLFSDDFLPAFNRANVTLVDTDGKGVDAITEDAIVAGGESYPIDCIIFATGFDVGAAPDTVGGYTVSGRERATLNGRFGLEARTVHGTQLSGFPNFHIVGGSVQGTKAFNFTHTLDMQADHAAVQIAQCLADDVHACAVTPAAEEAWAKVCAGKALDLRQFHEDCTPGFLNNEGNLKDKPTFVGATYGGGPIEYHALVTAWREQGAGDRDITYRRDMAAREAAE